MSIEITAGGFADLAAKLSSLSILEVADPVVRKAGVEVKRSMRADASGHKHAPRLAQSISFDVKHSANVIEVKIGPRKDAPTPGRDVKGRRNKGKGLGGSFAMYWLGNARMAPVLPHPDRYAKREAEQTVKHLAAALEKKLR